MAVFANQAKNSPSYSNNSKVSSSFANTEKSGLVLGDQVMTRFLDETFEDEVILMDGEKEFLDATFDDKIIEWQNQSKN